MPYKENNAVIAKAETDAKEHVLYHHILALLAVKNAASEFLKGGNSEPLKDALENKIFESDEDLFLRVVENIIGFVLPGPDVVISEISVVTIKNPRGDPLVGVVMQLQPGKRVIRLMSLPFAERFEKELTETMDRHFGRIIRV